jgi:hypothetical protein
MSPLDNLKLEREILTLAFDAYLQFKANKSSKEYKMKRTVLVALWALVFVFGLIVGSTVRPHSVAAATCSVESWGLIENPNGSVYKVLVLYDRSTGEIWGYQESEGFKFPPVRIGKLTKVGEPVVK